MNRPHVSCIMPTRDRPNYIKLAIHYFLNQFYRDAELIIVDDGRNSIEMEVPPHRRIKYHRTEPFSSLGSKRNYACEVSLGEVIMHWDDDDYYSQDWINNQLDVLNKSNADIIGLHEILMYSPLVNRYWNYKDDENVHPWIAGATMAYKKSFWQQHPFKDITVGEDYDFIWNSGGKVYGYSNLNGFVAVLHAWNTTMKPFEKASQKKHGIQFMDVHHEGDPEYKNE